MAKLSDNNRGALFMAAAMFLFAFEDFFIKGAAETVPVGQILMMNGILGALVFGYLTYRNNETLFAPAFIAPRMLVRSAFEITGRLFYGLAIALTPLSTASAILQAAPLVVMGGAAIFLREKISPARWLAVALGFCGMLIILQPGTDGFSVLSLFAVAGMAGFSGRDLATRAAPKVLSNTQLGLIGFMMLTIAGLILLAISGGAVLPSLTNTTCILASGLCATLGYAWLTNAMRTGDVGAVTPFRYLRLVFAIILAMVFFDETPGQSVIAGSSLIVAAGIFGLTRKS